MECDGSSARFLTSTLGAKAGAQLGAAWHLSLPRENHIDEFQGVEILLVDDKPAGRGARHARS